MTHKQRSIVRDQKLISTVAKGLRLYEEYRQLSIEAEAAAGGPCDPPAKVKKRGDQAAQLFMSVRQMPATCLQGLAAKARLFAALDDPDASGPEYPMGVEGVARSICADLARLTSSPPACRNSTKAAQ